MNEKQIRRLAYSGVCTAVIALLTAFVRLPFLPMASGYAHLGDCGIVLSAMLLGSHAALPAAVGSALADILAGFPQYALFTFLIKGVVGLLLGRLLRTCKFSLMNAAYLLLAGAIIVVAYFFTDSLLYGFAAAIASLAGNGAQALSMLAGGLAIIPAVNAIPNELKRHFPR